MCTWLGVTLPFHQQLLSCLLRESAVLKQHLTDRHCSLFLPGCKTASLGLHSFLNGNVSRLFLHLLRTPAIQHSSGPVPSDVAAPVAYCRETELAEIPLHSLCLTIPLAEESKCTVLALRSASDHFHPYGSVFILGCHPTAP